MSDVQKVSVALTPEFVALVKEAIDTGEYTSASEVIRDALRHWKRRRAIPEMSTEELRDLWQEGSAAAREKGHCQGGTVSKRTSRLRRTAQAEQDLIDIWAYIARANPSAA